ncbi:SIMPL domain-containing protein [Martelella sp. HB161492]|uniref:SIMPL domain-containing protein n=1 Tax=Martelella sp. HB161492 TaxID=2720726 RepID=UPI0015910A7B|nr:SIMPL domain-containing protein [Martelella sp. HB161492]
MFFSGRQFAAAALVVLPLVASPVLAQEQAMPAPVATISVAANGSAGIAPDMAIVSLAVVSSAETAEAALADNNQSMQNVLDALKASGIAAKDIQTDNFSINPQYKQVTADDGSESRVVSGYQVVNGLDVTVRALDNLGAVLDQSVKLGVNSGGNITFTNADPSAAQEEARKQAVTRAMAKAKTLAEAAGVSLGSVLSISEGGSAPQPLMRTASFAMKDMGSVPIATGENSYDVTVNMTFAIAQ